MKKLLIGLAFVALLAGLSLGLSASTAQANSIHYCTLDDNGTTETLVLGEDLVLNLGSDHTWKVTVVDPYGHPVLAKVWVRNGEPTLAYFHTIGAGQSIIRAYGFPKCSACPPYIRQYQLNVVVQ